MLQIKHHARQPNPPIKHHPSNTKHLQRQHRFINQCSSMHRNRTCSSNSMHPSKVMVDVGAAETEAMEDMDADMEAAADTDADMEA